PAATPAARRRPTTGTNAGTKSLANHRDSHHRNHRPGSPTAKSSLKLKTTLKDLATKVRYATSGTAPGSGGPAGSFGSPGVRVVAVVGWADDRRFQPSLRGSAGRQL